MMFDSAPKRLIRSAGGRAPFAAVASRLSGAGITLGNLECPLSNRGHAVGAKEFTFQGDPRAVQGLAWAGFDFVSLANNHAGDYGPTALRDTFGYLKAGGIAWAGAGVDRAAAWRPAIVVRNGARIAFLAFSEIGPGSMAKVGGAIKAAHKRADYVIVSFHWGVERSYTPTARQVSDGRAAVRAGADMVLSEHPHVLQGVEFYRHAIIAYSLGNFVFSPGTKAGRDTMILHATMTPKGVTAVSAEPCYIGSNGRPVPAKGGTLRRILALIKRTCRGRGTRVSASGATARLVP
jgi:poly-gamma-glutamate synthesis protein (capsule biosynthesis protein)